MQNKINVEWLKEENFDDKYHTRVVFVDGTCRVMDSWTDEDDIIDVESRRHVLRQLELEKYFTPSHARWINDDAHKELAKRIDAMEVDNEEGDIK